MMVMYITRFLNKQRIFWLWLVHGVFGLSLWLPTQVLAAGTVNIYSHRQQVLIRTFLDAFTEATSIETKTVYAAKGLAQRLQAEGAASPADVILTADIARLAEYAALDLLAPVDSAVLTANVPARLRACDNRWFGLSECARILVASKDRVPFDAIQTIEDFAKDEWRGRICTRPGSHVYNRPLMASLIAAHGAEAAESWARDFVANLVRKPQGNDRAQAKAISQGICDVAIMNSYYFGKMKFSDDLGQRSWAESLRLIFTNQKGRGNHINISGAGIVKHSPNKKVALLFLEFLTDEVAQQLYGTIHYEYPVNPSFAQPAELASWGVFKRDELHIERLAALAPEAQMIIDRVGW